MDDLSIKVLLGKRRSEHDGIPFSDDSVEADSVSRQALAQSRQLWPNPMAERYDRNCSTVIRLPTFAE